MPTTEIEILMMFTRNGVPASDIKTFTPNFPTVRIWDITDGTNTVITSEVMDLVEEGSANDGFYKFVFTNAHGFDETRKYVCSFDAGTSIPDFERYLSGYIIPNYQNEIMDKLDSMTDESDITSLTSKMNQVLYITDYLRKFETNRTWIDVNNAELIVYDDDCQTVLWKLKLLDCNGDPNVEEIAARVPITGGSGPWPTCSQP